MADFDWIFENNSIKLPELSVYKGRLKSKKQPAQPVSLQNPSSQPLPRPLSRGRELERGQQAARLVFGQLGCWERLPKFRDTLSPTLPHGGRGQVAADSGVAGRLKKNARNINGRNFSGSLYRKADGTNAASVFSDGL